MTIFVLGMIYFSYIHGIMTTKIWDTLNNIEPTTDSTHILENNILAFLDVLLKNHNKKQEFRIQHIYI